MELATSRQEPLIFLQITSQFVAFLFPTSLFYMKYKEFPILCHNITFDTKQCQE